MACPPAKNWLNIGLIWPHSFECFSAPSSMSPNIAITSSGTGVLTWFLTMEMIDSSRYLRRAMKTSNEYPPKPSVCPGSTVAPIWVSENSRTADCGCPRDRWRLATTAGARVYAIGAMSLISDTSRSTRFCSFSRTAYFLAISRCWRFQYASSTTSRSSVSVLFFGVSGA